MDAARSGLSRRGTATGDAGGRKPGLALPISSVRLLLRDFRDEDEAAVLECRCDPRVTRHLPYGPRDADSARRHLRELLRQQQDPRRQAWELAVVQHGDGAVVGACDLTLSSPKEAEIGYVLARRYWGQGFGTEVATALIDAAFDGLRVERVTSTVAVANRRSLRVMEKAGLDWDGTSRRHAQVQGKWWDVHLYSISREAWRQAGAQRPEA